MQSGFNKSSGQGQNNIFSGQGQNNIFSMFSSVLSTKEQSQPRTATPLPSMTGSSSSSGDFFIRMSLDLLFTSKELKRNDQVKHAISAALDALDNPESSNPITVFKPFQLACQTGIPELVTIAIDCLGKLFTYNYWKFAANIHVEYTAKPIHPTEDDSIDNDNDGTSEMITFVITTICDTFIGESTDEKVQLQIIKALQAALTNSDPTFSLHGAILLKAIRTTYNIFLLSKSNDVQIVAQGTVTQMVQNVMSRIPLEKMKPSIFVSDPNSTPPTPPTNPNPNQTTNEQVDSLPLPPFNGEHAKSPSTMAPADRNYDREFKDAFKVFRTLCVLSVKAIPNPEGIMELRSQPIRSKLLALHLLITIVSSHGYIFSLPSKSLFSLVKDATGTPETFRFIDSVKDFMILSLTRNATSMIPPIFEASVDLFGKIWTGLRTLLKKEIAVYFTEIVIPILEGRKNIMWYQRYNMLKCLSKSLSSGGDPGQLWVELFLNYDCDAEATAKENIWERAINALSKITSQHVDSAQQELPIINCFVNLGQHGSPALTTNNLVALNREQTKELLSLQGDAIELRKQAILVLSNTVLKSLSQWCEKRVPRQETKKVEQSEEKSSKATGFEKESSSFDDPTAIRSLKQKKEHVIEGVKRFNKKPKKGIQYLVETGCIESKTPKDIAHFLSTTEGLNKTMIGEYLGEGDEENISIMHEFVEHFEFVDQGFVDALRNFLQSFRLPGEAQKIDRFMLKFAARYLAGNSESFSSADTAYVLAYSVIMLNTDQHNNQVKRKMVKQDFIKNNRGIDGGKDLPEELLSKIFDEIASHEIIMKDELPAKAALASKELLDNKKALAQRNESMALKTEQMMKNKKDEKSAYITANHYAHVQNMFEKIWMSVLTGLSTPLQESDDAEAIMACLNGVRAAIKITCIFDMELEKNTFISSLSKFTLLNNIQEMREKNLEAIGTLLEIAHQEGGSLGSSWKDVVSCISQLEKLQIVGEKSGDDLRQKQPDASKRGNKGFIEEASAVASSQMMTLIVDKIFTSSSKLSGAAIVHFVRALCETSWDEISSSLNQEQPRMYCLQRLVEISYYNMNRIRVEWSNIWAILGDHFNQVGCYPNTNVALFALDKLRQLTMKFLDLAELPNFKFQKDFLRPFEEIVKNNPDPKIKDMCLICLQQIIQVKGSNIKSGWKTLCGSLIRAAREVNEPLVNLAFDITKAMLKNNFESIATNSSLHDYVACLVEFCKNKKTAKINLQSVELLKQCIQKVADSSIVNFSKTAAMVQSPDAGTVLETSQSSDNLFPGGSNRTGTNRKITVSPEEDLCIRLWMPILFGLHDVIMTCELEVRTKALSHLFDALKAQGNKFSTSFWELLSKGVLFPIFDDMKQTPSAANNLNSKFASKEELSIWLSTTLIQALRQFVDLFTLYYQKIGFMLPAMLGLMKSCLLHENEALSRIGSTCIQQLVESNAKSFDEKAWENVSGIFDELSAETAPAFLFFKYKENDSALEAKFSKVLKISLPPAPEKKEFQKQIVKCVSHLMVIQTLQDLLSSGQNDEIFKIIPNKDLFRLIDCFQSSYDLARTFNESMELRQALFKMGYMKQLPNLLKQETLSANAYLTLLIKLFLDSSPGRVELRVQTQERLIPLCLEIIDQYNSIDSDNRQRNLTAWRPVVYNILSAVSKFDDEHFKNHIHKFYPPAIKLLLQEMTPEIRLSIHAILQRTGVLYGLVSAEEAKKESNVNVPPPSSGGNLSE